MTCHVKIQLDVWAENPGYLLHVWDFTIQLYRDYNKPWKKYPYEPTPPKFNIDPEKLWLEDYFPIGKVTFQGLC